jgi:hypothetical protein
VEGGVGDEVDLRQTRRVQDEAQALNHHQLEISNQTQKTTFGGVEGDEVGSGG